MNAHRAISDGAFAALIVDVAVHPDFQVRTAAAFPLCTAMSPWKENLKLPMLCWLQRRGIGRKLVGVLQRTCTAKGATGFLVFAPRERVPSCFVSLFLAALSLRILQAEKDGVCCLQIFWWKCGFRLGSRYKVMGFPQEGGA